MTRPYGGRQAPAGRWRMGTATAKDLALNYFPISWSLRECAVVPLWEVVVKEDFHGALEALRALAAGRVNLVEEAYRHAEAGAGFRPLDELFGDLHGVEDHSLTGPGDVGEHAVLDRVVLGTIRRIVGHAQFQAKSVRQALQVFLEQVLRGAVAAAAV